MEIGNWKLGIGVAGLVVAAFTVAAGEPAKVEPVLEPDTNLLAKIAALPDNTWMKLPKFRVTGDLGWLPPNAEHRKRGPFGRSYCGYAVWAPERKRAVFMGGGHNVQRWSDVWEYDLAANAWVCLLGNDPAGTQKNTEEWFRENTKMAEDGCIIKKSGGPVAISHTWNQFCYDPDRRVALWINSMPRSVEYSIKLDDENNVAVKGLGMPFEEFKKKLCKDGIYVWEFDPAKRQFTRRELVVNLKGPGNTTGGRQEDGLMRYLPHLKTSLFNNRLRDPQTGEWKPLEAKNGPAWYASNGDYDPDTKQFFVVNRNTMHALSADAKEWTLVSTNAPGPFRYDTTARELVAITRPEKTWVVAVFDQKKGEWISKPAPQGESPADGPYWIGYYDPDRNVHVLYNSIDVYVYRCKRAVE